MPVRSSNSHVLKWPDAATVSRALLAWAEARAQERPELVRVGYSGSYARGDWGVGSDLDVVIVVDSAAKPPSERGLDWRAESLPVPADVSVFTVDEWQATVTGGSRRGRVLAAETKWIWSRSGPATG